MKRVNTQVNNFGKFASSRCSVYLRRLHRHFGKRFTNSFSQNGTPLHNLQANNIHLIIGENVAIARKKHGMSQLDLALSIGHKSATVISKAELGREGKHFSIEHLYKIACVLDLPIEYFFDGLTYDLYNTSY